MKIAFVSEVWSAHIASGVVTWLVNMKKELEARGIDVQVIHAGLFPFTLPVPSDPSIPLSLFGYRRMEKLLLSMNPDQIHLVTEGPLGFAALQVCRKHHWRFTTYYHTRMPEHIQLRIPGIQPITRRYFKWFHSFSSCVMVPTVSFKEELEGQGIKNLCVATHGVDMEIYKRNPRAAVPDGLEKPIFVSFGRLAPEKTTQRFLECDLPGTKVVAGTGSLRWKLERRYGKQARFLGFVPTDVLVDLLSVSDVFVFPSSTDTFGLAILEAMACGLPVAAYDAVGPRDLVEHGVNGYLGENLQDSAIKCLTLKREDCINTARRYPWKAAADSFLEKSVNIR